MDNDAVFPSSPPHATAIDPPSSPFFEPQHHYGAFSPKSSSPAPIFSSDDSRESVDVTNYQSPRVLKNKRKGAWYETDRGESALTTPEPKKTKIARNYDSGIYMMSDVSANSDDLLPEHNAPFSFADDGYEVGPTLTSTAEALFCSRLREGLDKDSQSYDFTYMDLEDRDIKHVGDLSSVIKNPPDPGNDLPVESQYRSMAPELFVNLGNNNLRRLTPSLFHLEHLTTLTLRNNQIEELPPQIGQLRNLKTLDVSLNKLRQLPFELVQMVTPYGHLDRINTMGNPFLKPVQPDNLLVPRRTPSMVDLLKETLGDSPYLEKLYEDVKTSQSSLTAWRIRYHEAWMNFRLNQQSLRPLALTASAESFPHHPVPLVEDLFGSTRYMARTLVSYFDQAGVIMKGSPTLPESNSDSYPIIIETNKGAYGVPESPIYSPPSSSCVASLATSCINVALQQDTVAETTYKIGEPVPFDIAAILTQAAHNDADMRYGYFRQCHICNKDYIVARAEWIEFWVMDVSIIPLRIKVCSWGCVPTKVAKQPERILG